MADLGFFNGGGNAEGTRLAVGGGVGDGIPSPVIEGHGRSCDPPQKIFEFGTLKWHIQPACCYKPERHVITQSKTRVVDVHYITFTRNRPSKTNVTAESVDA